MAKEYETKILDINVKEVINKLKSLGAEIGENKLQKRWVFDMGESYFDKKAKWWIRLRDDGFQTTITYKSRKGTGIGDTEEIEVEVSDFEEAYKILSKLNFKSEYYQENKRIFCKLGEIEFCIDKWPKIPALLEIESKTEKQVKEGLKMINMEGKDIGNVSVQDIYSKYNINLHGMKELTF